MSTRLVAGKPGAVKTGESRSKGDQNIRVVRVEGPYSEIENINLDQFVPRNCNLVNSQLEDDGNGFGKWTLTCESNETEYDGSSPYRVTWKIEMVEVQKDLKTHPSVVDDRANIERWLATEPAKRIDDKGDPQWIDENGAAHKINDNTGAWKYGDAYMRGIESYVVHYPVVEKISYYKSIPGCTTYKGTVTGGNAQFSKDIDKWSPPGITLAGYGSDGWLKSGDGYQQDGGKAWVRTEQWTWTPDGSSSPTGWIYSAAKK